MDKRELNVALVLAGGNGSRLGSVIPKQFIAVAGRPIISFCLATLEKSTDVDAIVIVAAENWRKKILESLQVNHITKFAGFAEPGLSRQHSVFSGLSLINTLFPATKFVLIHDAARPNVTLDLISNCFKSMNDVDGVLPALPVKDTVYLSKDGETINTLLSRKELFAGQAPEVFDFKNYFVAHLHNLEKLHLINGSSELAVKEGMRIRIIQGEEANYKITTKADLERFRKEKE